MKKHDFFLATIAVGCFELLFSSTVVFDLCYFSQLFYGNVFKF